MKTRQEGLLARFAVRKGQLTAAAVKRKLVEPNRHLELSVFRVHELGDTEVRELGVDVVHRRPDANRLYGWAEFDEALVHSVSLTLHDDDDPPRHANVVGWPTDRDERKLVESELADKATPVPVNPPIEVPDFPA